MPAHQRPALGDLLIGAAIPLTLPFGIALEMALLCLAIYALRLLWRQRGRPWPNALREYFVLALLLWLAGAISAIDAEHPGRALAWLGAAIGYVLAGAALVMVCDDPDRRGAVLLGAAVPVACWTLDATLQAVTGWSLGGPASADRLSGVFGADDLKLGPVLALLAPFLLIATQQIGARRSRRFALIVSGLALTLVVLLAGARAGWIGLAVAGLALSAHWQFHQPRRWLLALTAGLLVTLLLTGLAYQQSERFAARIDRTLTAFDGSRAGLDHALAGRLPIFETAVTAARAHPLNGIGVRGFRQSYPRYAASGDPWVSPDGQTGASHPHHWVLEVAAEQGAIGLLAWLLLTGWLIHRWWRADTSARSAALAPALALLTLLFPLNTHPALYSSFWQALCWWCLGLYLGCLSTRAGTSTEPQA